MKHAELAVGLARERIVLALAGKVPAVAAGAIADSVVDIVRAEIRVLRREREEAVEALRAELIEEIRRSR